MDNWKIDHPHKPIRMRHIRSLAEKIQFELINIPEIIYDPMLLEKLSSMVGYSDYTDSEWQSVTTIVYGISKYDTISKLKNVIAIMQSKLIAEPSIPEKLDVPLVDALMKPVEEKQPVMESLPKPDLIETATSNTTLPLESVKSIPLVSKPDRGTSKTFKLPACRYASNLIIKLTPSQTYAVNEWLEMSKSKEGFLKSRTAFYQMILLIDCRLFVTDYRLFSVLFTYLTVSETLDLAMHCLDVLLVKLNVDIMKSELRYEKDLNSEFKGCLSSIAFQLFDSTMTVLNSIPEFALRCLHLLEKIEGFCDFSTNYDYYVDRYLSLLNNFEIKAQEDYAIILIMHLVRQNKNCVKQLLTHNNLFRTIFCESIYHDFECAKVQLISSPKYQERVVNELRNRLASLNGELKDNWNNIEKLRTAIEKGAESDISGVLLIHPDPSVRSAATTFLRSQLFTLENQFDEALFCKAAVSYLGYSLELLYDAFSMCRDHETCHENIYKIRGHSILEGRTVSTVYFQRLYDRFFQPPSSNEDMKLLRHFVHMIMEFDNYNLIPENKLPEIAIVKKLLSLFGDQAHFPSPFESNEELERLLLLNDLILLLGHYRNNCNTDKDLFGLVISLLGSTKSHDKFLFLHHQLWAFLIPFIEQNPFDTKNETFDHVLHCILDYITQAQINDVELIQPVSKSYIYSIIALNSVIRTNEHVLEQYETLSVSFLFKLLSSKSGMVVYNGLCVLDFFITRERFIPLLYENNRQFMDLLLGILHGRDNSNKLQVCILEKALTNMYHFSKNIVEYPDMIKEYVSILEASRFLDLTFTDASLHDLQFNIILLFVKHFTSQQAETIMRPVFQRKIKGLKILQVLRSFLEMKILKSVFEVDEYVGYETDLLNLSEVILIYMEMMKSKISFKNNSWFNAISENFEEFAAYNSKRFLRFAYCCFEYGESNKFCFTEEMIRHVLSQVLKVSDSLFPLVLRLSCLLDRNIVQKVIIDDQLFESFYHEWMRLMTHFPELPISDVLVFLNNICINADALKNGVNLWLRFVLQRLDQDPTSAQSEVLWVFIANMTRNCSTNARLVMSSNIQHRSFVEYITLCHPLAGYVRDILQNLYSEPEFVGLIIKTNVISVWFEFFNHNLKDVKALLKRKKTMTILEILLFLSKSKEIQYYLVRLQDTVPLLIDFLSNTDDEMLNLVLFSICIQMANSKEIKAYFVTQENLMRMLQKKLSVFPYLTLSFLRVLMHNHQKAKVYVKRSGWESILESFKSSNKENKLLPLISNLQEVLL